MNRYIRPARPADAGRIAEIYVTNYRVNFYPFLLNAPFYFGDLNVLDTAAEYAEGWEALAGTFVYDDGIVKGFIRIIGDFVEKLYVEPQFQSGGIGAELIEFAIKEKGADDLWALEYNKRGISFYKRHGFRLTGEKMFEDGWVPLLRLSRSFREPEITLGIITPDSPHKEALEAINTDSFPKCERASLDELFATGRDGNLEITGIFVDNVPVGFFAVRKFGQLRYLAYFAVKRSRRGKGIGSRALRLLLEHYEGCQVVAEFEAPDEGCENNAVRLRRRDFYLRNGFCETGWYSFYDETEFTIVCSRRDFDKREFDRFTDYLSTFVSDHIPHLYRRDGTVVTVTDRDEKTAYAREILEDLTDWFEIEENREKYISESADQPFFAAFEGGKCAGFLALKETGKSTVELAVMGARRSIHRSGTGRRLVEKAVETARAAGYEFMQVKTVKMGVYEDYDRTNRFYLACGFKELEVFPDYWDEANPCQIYVMAL